MELETDKDTPMVGTPWVLVQRSRALAIGADMACLIDRRTSHAAISVVSMIGLQRDRILAEQEKSLGTAVVEFS